MEIREREELEISLGKIALGFLKKIKMELPCTCEMYSQNNKVETYLAVQWLRHWNSTAEGMSSIPNWGARIPYAMWHGQKIEK